MNEFAFIAAMLINIAIYYYIYCRATRKKVYLMASDSWVSVSEFPTDQEREVLTQYIITDGVGVKVVYDLTYNNKGQPIFPYNYTSQVTHWMPLPAPPKVK